MLVEVPHVTDGIDRGDDPQKRRDSGEYHAERIGPESQVNPRKNLPNRRKSTVPPESTVGAIEATIANRTVACQWRD